MNNIPRIQPQRKPLIHANVQEIMDRTDRQLQQGAIEMGSGHMNDRQKDNMIERGYEAAMESIIKNESEIVGSIDNHFQTMTSLLTPEYSGFQRRFSRFPLSEDIIRAHVFPHLKKPYGTIDDHMNHVDQWFESK